MTLFLFLSLDLAILIHPIYRKHPVADSLYSSCVPIKTTVNISEAAAVKPVPQRRYMHVVFGGGGGGGVGDRTVYQENKCYENDLMLLHSRLAFIRAYISIIHFASIVMGAIVIAPPDNDNCTDIRCAFVGVIENAHDDQQSTFAKPNTKPN